MGIIYRAISPSGKSYIGQTICTLEHHTEKTKNEIAIKNSKIIYKVITPDGQIKIVKNLKKYCRENNLTASCMHRVGRKEAKQYKGYLVDKIDG